MPDKANPKKPSAALAAKAVERLVSSGLLDAKHREKAEIALAQGTAKASDWQLWADLSMGAEIGGDGEPGDQEADA